MNAEVPISEGVATCLASGTCLVLPRRPSVAPRDVLLLQGTSSRAVHRPPRLRRAPACSSSRMPLACPLQPNLLMPIIQYILPNKNKQLKKMLAFYWE